MPFMRLLTITLAIVSLPLFVQAQDSKAKTILVLDASGSMWGQIDGVAKITIAQDVIDGLLDDIPDDQPLGLSAYGHNRKGDCKDIEMLVPPAEGTKQKISKAVNAIKPKGKTPLSEAVIRAAEYMQYEENKATVILVSDGIETCDYDPCDVGKLLEETGIDFTAHVVGFDVASPADRAQLQCLAENTGGSFLTASNSDELSDALKKLAAYVPQELTFRAVESDIKAQILTGLRWTIIDTRTSKTFSEAVEQAEVKHVLEKGVYQLVVERDVTGETIDTVITVDKNLDPLVTIEMAPYIPDATIDAPIEALMGSVLDLAWTGPLGEDDLIVITKPTEKNTTFSHKVSAHNNEKGKLQLPPDEGAYELRYLFGPHKRVLAKKAIDLHPVRATLDAPQTVAAGQTIDIGWDGPRANGDSISVAVVGADGASYLERVIVTEQGDVSLQMPTQVGPYELRYVMGDSKSVLLRQSINVTEIDVKLIAPETALAGQNLSIEWAGPNYDQDFISVAERDANGVSYINRAETSMGNPIMLRMPGTPGEYELRYVAQNQKTVLASQSITIEPVSAEITAPAVGKIGQNIMVDWTGPAFQFDEISIAKTGQNGVDYITRSFTDAGTPVGVRMPAEPGEYEIRYVLGDSKEVLARSTITLEAVDVSIEAPSSGVAGETIEVNWTGPNYVNDEINIAPVGADGFSQLQSVITASGNPAVILLPTEPGAYEIRYVLGESRKVLARIPLSVN